MDVIKSEPRTIWGFRSRVRSTRRNCARFILFFPHSFPPVIAINHQLTFKALNQKNFPMNISFQLAYQLQDFAKKFLYRFFFNVQTKKPDRFLNLCIEHLFLTGLTLSSLSISEDELWYMWCLTTLYATKLVFPIKPVLTHLITPEFSPDLL